LARATGGTLFEGRRSEELSEAASALVFDVLGVARSQVGAAQLDDSTGTFTIRLPAMGLDLARVLITAETAIDHIVVSGNGANVGIQTGQRFALVEISRPLDPIITIELAAAGMSSASLSLEWDLQVITETASDGTARIWLADSMGENVLLHSFFNESKAQNRVEDGYLNWHADTEEALQAIQAHLETFGINTRQEIEIPEIKVSTNSPASPPENLNETSEITEDIVEVPMEGAVFVERDPWFTLFPFLLTVFVVAILLLLCLLYLRIRRGGRGTPRVEQVSTEAPAAQRAVPRFEFAGKLDLYLNTTPTRRESTPQTVQMLRLGKKRAALSLREILRKSRIADKFPGSDQIQFTADGQGSLYVEADLAGTVLIGTKPLTERQRHVLSQGESVRVHSEDQTQELEVSPRFLYRKNK